MLKRTLKGILAGAALVLAFAVVAAYVLVTAGWLPANADAPPNPLEKWAARRSLHATIRREAPVEHPPEPSDRDLVAGVRLYAVNCAVCHGASDGKASNVAKGLYQKPPQLASHGVEDDAVGETFWIVKHGVRLTGMPAYSPTLSDEDVWKLAWFLHDMDHLPAAAAQAWKALPSQGR